MEYANEVEEVNAAIENLRSGKVLVALDKYKHISTRPPTSETIVQRTLLDQLVIELNITKEDHDEWEKSGRFSEEESPFGKDKTPDPLEVMKKKLLEDQKKHAEEQLQEEEQRRREAEEYEKELLKMKNVIWGDQETQRGYDEKTGDKKEEEEEEENQSQHSKHTENRNTSVSNKSESREDKDDATLAIITNFDALLETIGQVGMTLTPEEEAPLLFKFNKVRGLSIRDVVMYLEGVRTRSTITEARISMMLEDNQKLTSSLIAQTRILDKFIVEVKEKERKHIKQMDEEIHEKREALDKREAALNDLEKSLKKRMEAFAKEKKTASSSLFEPTSYKTPSISTPLLSTPRSAGPSFKAEEIAAAFERAQKKVMSMSEEPCTAFSLICMDQGFTAADYVNFYKLPVSTLNNLIKDFPETESALKKKFGSMREAGREFLVRIRYKQEEKSV